MNQLAQSELSLDRAYSVLAKIPAESVWLANFHSDNTRNAYRRAIGEFIATCGLATPEELYNASQAHVIAWRSDMKAKSMSNATIANRLSALSSRNYSAPAFGHFAPRFQDIVVKRV